MHVAATKPGPVSPTGPDHGRRFLIAGAVTHYSRQPAWDRGELAGDLRQMVALFTEDLGYEHVPTIGLDPTWRQIKDALRTFGTAPERRRDDYLVVYLAGHGDILPAGAGGAEHVLLPADAVPGDLRRRAVRSADLAEWILADTPVARLLLLMDTCFSGLGGADFTRNAVAWAGNADQSGWPDGSGVVVVSATQPRQEAIAGVFAGGFIRAVRDPAVAGCAAGRLTVDAVINAMNADPAVPRTQRAQWSLVLGNGEIPDFLPHPRLAPGLADVALRTWQRQFGHEHLRAQELRDQFAPRAAGFIGRRRALADISYWLEGAADSRPRVVTGDPGSGKTAVLAVLAALRDPRHRPTVARDGLPAGIASRVAAIDVAIYAGTLLSSQVLAALAAAGGVADADFDPADFDLGVARLLTALDQRERPLIAIIDAVDEAADPAHLAGRLLRPLIEQGRDRVRLLLGMRRHACRHLGPAWARGCEVIDLDAPRYDDPGSLVALVRRTLRDHPGGAAAAPFADCSPEILQAAASAIAAAAGKSFFVARILAATQASQPALPEVSDPRWRDSLPSQAGPAMWRDLESRLHADAGRAVELLRPLAYAQGGGLPWEDIWPRLASVLSGGRICCGSPIARGLTWCRAGRLPTAPSTRSITVPWPTTCGRTVTRSLTRRPSPPRSPRTYPGASAAGPTGPPRTLISGLICPLTPIAAASSTLWPAIPGFCSQPTRLACSPPSTVPRPARRPALRPSPTVARGRSCAAARRSSISPTWLWPLGTSMPVILPARRPPTVPAVPGGRSGHPGSRSSPTRSSPVMTARSPRSPPPS
jgi:hypothetical protein